MLLKLFLITTIGFILPDKQMERISTTPIYHSTADSYQEDFFLVFENQGVSIYGWEVTIDNDTIYYRSRSKIIHEETGKLTIRLKNYEFSRTKITTSNLSKFEEDKELNFAPLFCHSSFFLGTGKGSKIEFLAVKHIYLSRADKFIFERIE